MKTLKLFFTMAILALCSSSVFAQNGNSNGNGNSGQNGNAVISAVQVWDNGNGTGTVEFRISGNLAPLEPSGTITISGARISGDWQQSFIRSKSADAGYIAIFPLLPKIGNGADFVDVIVNVPGVGPKFSACWKMIRA